MHFLPLKDRTLTRERSDVRNGICVEPPCLTVTFVPRHYPISQCLLVNPGHLGGQGKQCLLVMPGLLGLVTFTPGPAIEINPARKCVAAVSSAERFEIWPRLCGATASGRPPETAYTTEHFNLTADDSQDERVADGMCGCELACPYRAPTPHRVKNGCSARRWPVRRRVPCDARDTTQEHKENRAPTRRELQTMGGRVGLFVEWAEYIETEGGTLEEQRLEHRELLGKMAVFEEEVETPLPGGSMTRRRTRGADCAFSEMEHDGSFHMQSAAPPKRVRRIKRLARRKRR